MLAKVEKKVDKVEKMEIKYAYKIYLYKGRVKSRLRRGSRSRHHGGDRDQE